MRAARVDRNQPEIVFALRAVGASVQHLHKVGEGCPDLLVGYRKENYLMEIKDGQRPPSGRELNPDQIVWHTEWRGHVQVVNNIAEALALIGATKESND